MSHAAHSATMKAHEGARPDHCLTGKRASRMRLHDSNFPKSGSPTSRTGLIHPCEGLGVRSFGPTLQESSSRAHWQICPSPTPRRTVYWKCSERVPNPARAWVCGCAKVAGLRISTEPLRGISIPTPGTKNKKDRRDPFSSVRPHRLQQAQCSAETSVAARRTRE